jgi:hypothetical protein
VNQPNALFLRAYLLRGASLWLGGRVLVSALLLLAGVDPFALTASSSLQIVGIIVALGLIDTLRRHERALLGNLGVSFPMLALVIGAPALLGELVVRLMMDVR